VKEGSRKAIIAAFLANLGIAIAKLVGFVITGAASMLAEAVHSVADASNQGLLLLGGSRARRPETAEHPFGYGRERYFWSFVVALVLFSLGGLFALFEGVEKLRHPHELESVTVAAVILGLAIVFEIFSFRTAIHESRRVKGDQSWWSFIRHSKQPELPVVLLEDLGALLDLVFALVGVVVAHVTHDARYDAVGSMAIGVLLVAIAVTLAIEMKSLLIGEAASPAALRSIRGAMEGSDHVRRIIHMRTQHMGPDELLVAAKLELDDGLDAAGVCDVINATERAVRGAVPEARLVYLEPDVVRSTPPGAAPPRPTTSPSPA
jgi:cation diffusion facilitator family transporter